MIFVRNEFNYDMDEASYLTGLACEEGSSMTKQEFKEECDINTIVRNFGLTGEMPPSLVTPMQGDFTEVTDYRSALHLIMEADAAFMEIPAEIRERFQNDPGRFVEFVSATENLPQLREWGLASVERPAEPLLVRMAPDDLAPSSSPSNPPSGA